NRHAISTRPPPATSPFSRLRRLTFSIAYVRAICSMSHPPSPTGRGQADRSMDALITAAATEIAGQTLIDLFVAGLGVGGEQRRSLHDLSHLAETTLRHVHRTPCFLDRMFAAWIKPFDRNHRLVAHLGHGRRAGADGLSRHVHGTSTAK